MSGQDSELDDIERRVRNALRLKVEAVEPSSDAFLRLAEAVAEATPGGWKNRLRLGLMGGASPLWSPLVYVTAVVAVSVGLTMTVLQGSDDSNLAAVGPATPGIDGALGEDGDVRQGEEDSTADIADEADGGSAENNSVSASGGSPAGSQAAIESASASTSGESDEIAAAEQSAPLSNGYAPLRGEVADAVDAFIDLLDQPKLSELSREVDATRAQLRAVGSVSSIVSEIRLEEEAGAFAVTALSSDLIEVDLAGGEAAEPEATGDSALGDSTLGDSALGDVSQVSKADGDAEHLGDQMTAVVEAGPGVELVRIDLLSALSGARLALDERAIPNLGSASQSWTFNSSMSLNGSSRAWMVVTGLSSAGVVLAVHAEPILFTGTPDNRPYTVVGLRPSDNDGGLVVRDAPAGFAIDVLEFGATNILRTNAVAEVRGAVEWWSITSDDGTQGWVAAEHLMAVPDISPGTLEAWARTVLPSEPMSLPPLLEVDGQSLFGDQLTMGEIRRPIWAQDRFRLPRLLTSSGWETDRNLADLDGVERLSISFAEFYQVERWQPSLLSAGIDYVDASASEAAQSRFGTLPSFVVPISPVNADIEVGEESVDTTTAGTESDDPTALPGDEQASDVQQAAGATFAQRARQVRFYVADGAMAGQPTRPIIVGIVLEGVQSATEAGGSDSDPVDSDAADDPGDSDSDNTDSTSTDPNDTDPGNTDPGGGTGSGSGEDGAGELDEENG